MNDESEEEADVADVWTAAKGGMGAINGVVEVAGVAIPAGDATPVEVIEGWGGEEEGFDLTVELLLLLLIILLSLLLLLKTIVEL